MSEEIAGWELSRHGDRESYRKRLANGVTVHARWEGAGTVEAYVEPAGIGRTLTRSRKEFRDREAFFTAARLVVDTVANLPSFRMGTETHADHVLTGEVAGSVDTVPGSGGVPEAELTFTLTDGRSITLILTEDQADDLTSSIYSLSKHVWSEQREEEERAPATEAEVPDVNEVDAGPDSPHELMTVLEEKFGVTRDFMLAHVDWSAVVVVGEPAVSTLLDRADELAEAVAPRWFPGATERPGEVWVVLYRDVTR
ncbi:hypothetical protein GCM10011609_48000 [Lentzea pudingi]|uniref:Uncharacterized protein n=1 Tax=Lentzea pudingi TaxID=1789439 RepID=A0ABQ2I841_9PSEU|nr:hypothetical protein [Lentzea pudingi]GGN03346.1 hypothetical protein GCM10011609_48000 [Lentzea pudingi]